ncbi:hypothetical protein [Legionella parisiensis]|uniref:MAE-28990/MAE-18760-like HEPN domain-containing protein n=1 Tax=Legionella parisiensis TaxID=45071 RepID=A0A1E5JUG2_9GAMM|nr:hypothetical protein [Legionella parisiensis]KTD40835.1 hypothetical protein Lpar_2152 [Legionella parisiensis]OEH48184.1 hypothetical protein lpari_00835 [Legionella parisiensis]STX72223.1 Uncharacterised protein [Legionella parisiensis]
MMANQNQLVPLQKIAYFQEFLKNFNFFVKRSNDHWVQDLQDYNEYLEVDDPALSPHIDSFESRVDLYTEFKNNFPQLQRQAYIQLIFAKFEDFMNQLCVCFESELESQISYNDMYGSGIKRARTYLKKVIQLDFPDDIDEWNKINNINKIRDKISHAGGYIDKHNDILNIISTSQTLNLEKYSRDEIIFSEGYLTEVVSQFQSFIKHLQEQVVLFYSNNTIK